jgi:hypothetical protein
MDSSIDDDYPFIVLTETKFSILGSIHHDEGLNNFLSLPLNIFPSCSSSSVAVQSCHPS